MSDNNRTTTTTQIRNLYSDQMSYMNIKFFNTNLCFSLFPFVSKDNIGKSNYDTKNGLSTTVNFEGAYALYNVSKNIIDRNMNECDISIPCAAGATLNLRRSISQSGSLETIFIISKNGNSIPFKFQTINMQISYDNGQKGIKVIESGLGAFMKTIEGYLNGINADRHLDKLTDDYVKSIGGDQQQNSNSQQSSPNQLNQNYKNNNYRNNNYNSYKNYKSKQYNNGTRWQPPQQQNLNSYEIKN